MAQVTTSEPFDFWNTRKYGPEPIDTRRTDICNNHRGDPIAKLNAYS